jgi:hypothetical protein
MIASCSTELVIEGRYCGADVDAIDSERNINFDNINIY